MNFPKGKRYVFWGWFNLGSERNLSMGRRWGLSRRLISFGEWKELPDREKVGSLGRVVSLGELIEPPNGDEVDSPLFRGDTTAEDMGR
jgi:hypothetical protein